MQKHEFIIDETNVGVRMDRVLAGLLPDLSRTEIQNLAPIGNIKLNGNVVSRLSVKLALNDKIEIDVPIQAALDLAGQEMDLNILFEDDDIIVVNKPRGMPMYPGPGHKKDTLVQGLIHHTNGHLSSLGGEHRPGIVHRLDMNTSGVVIVAKTDIAFHKLSELFSKHTLVRKYIAFCWNIPKHDAAIITGNIGRHFKNRQKMSMVKTGGKEAETHIDLMHIWTRPNVSQIHCTLKTGRTHQIRVHLSAHGYPVMMDPLYGKDRNFVHALQPSFLLDFCNEHHGQMLHADTLEIEHPINGKTLKFRAPLPDDMTELQTALDDYQETFG